MKTILASLWLLLAWPLAASAQDDLKDVPTASLIDQLTQINKPVVGIAGGGMYDAFIADNSAPYMLSEVLGAPEPDALPAMRELVRRGVGALPDLLNHLSDDRPTQLTVGGNDAFAAELFQTEFEPRVSHDRGKMQWHGASKEFNGPYLVRVGDVCYALVGQIVNRHLTAVRYQPSAIIIVNSPIQMPELAQKTEADWQGVTADQLRTSLTDDFHDAPNFFLADDALRRLRFYFPDTYAGLSGKDADLRKEFEAREAKGEP